MLREVESFLSSNLVNKKDKLTLAVAYSAGIDSQVLLNIAYKTYR